MTRRISRRILHLGLLAVGTLIGPALASPARAADARETAAARQFYAGKYEEALASYVDLAVSTRNPAYMCEIGRCHYRLGHTDEAVKNLRDCLAQAKLDAKKRREFRALLNDLERGAGGAAPPPAAAEAPASAGAPAWAAPAAQAPPPPPPPQAAAPPLPPPGYPGPAQAAPPAPPAGPPPGYPPLPAGHPSAGAPLPPAGYPPAGAPPGQAGPPPAWGYPQQPAPPAGPPAQQLSPAADVNASAGRDGGGRTGAYVLGAVGLVGLLAGGGLTYLANDTFNQVEREYSAEKEKTGKRYNLLQFVGYGVGAAGLTTAIILLARSGGSSDQAAAPSSRLSFEIHPTGFGLRGRF
jgi:hypothetical protein